MEAEIEQCLPQLGVYSGGATGEQYDGPTLLMAIVSYDIIDLKYTSKSGWRTISVCYQAIFEVSQVVLVLGYEPN